MDKMRRSAFVLLALLAGGIPARPRDAFPARQLTSDSAREGFPSWSPDGKHIAFASGRSGHGDIYIMDVDVGKITSGLKAPGR